MGRVPKPDGRPRNPSHWFDVLGAAPAGPPLAGTIRADVCIIGAGITGLSTAYHLITTSPGLSVHVVEARHAGFGASGRNAGQMVVSFGGGDLGNLIRTHGSENMQTAFDYVASGMEGMAAVAAAEGFDCALVRSGTLKVGMKFEGSAETDRYLALCETIGQSRHLTSLTAAQIDAELHSPLLGEGLHDRRGGQFNPLAFVRGLRDAAVRAGVVLHEQSPVTLIETRGRALRVKTDGGEVVCDKLVLATNGYTHRLAATGGLGLARRQLPLIARATATDRITPEMWADAGWPRRAGVNIISSMFHSFAPTSDNRLVWVSGYNTRLPPNHDPLSDGGPMHDQFHIVERFFPRLTGLRTNRVWGGPISITPDWTPHVGFAGDERVLYACGCWGGGTALGFRNGRTLADLALDPASEASRLWFVARRKRRWPPVAGPIAARLLMHKRHSTNRAAASRIGLDLDAGSGLQETKKDLST